MKEQKIMKILFSVFAFGAILLAAGMAGMKEAFLIVGPQSGLFVNLIGTLGAIVASFAGYFGAVIVFYIGVSILVLYETRDAALQSEQKEGEPV